MGVTFWILIFCALTLSVSFLQHPWLSTLRRQLLEHLAFVTRQGLPMVPGLLALADERRGRSTRPSRAATSQANRLRALAGRLETSGSLATACRGEPGLLRPEQVELLERAETSGQLPALLGVLSQEEGERERTVWRLTEVVAYPLVVSVAVSMCLVFLDGAVFPKFDEIAESMGVAPSALLAMGPLATEVFFAGCALCLLFALPGALGAWLRKRALAVSMRLPGLGAQVRRWEHARWLRRVAGLTGLGATLPDALEQVAQPGTPYAQAAAEARQGHTLQQVLNTGLGRDARRLVPSLTLSVDRAGSLPRGLSAAAEGLHERATRRLVTTLEVVRPLPLLLCGAVVAVHCLGVWGLIISVQQSVTRSVW